MTNEFSIPFFFVPNDFSKKWKRNLLSIEGIFLYEASKVIFNIMAQSNPSLKCQAVYVLWIEILASEAG